MKTLLTTLCLMLTTLSTVSYADCRWTYHDRYNDIYACDNQSLTYTWDKHISKEEAQYHFEQYIKTHKQPLHMTVTRGNYYVEDFQY